MQTGIFAEILIIGDELLRGDRRDTHLFYLSGELEGIGVSVRKCTVIGDNLEEIATAAGTAARESAVLVVCGGLGPTPDDVTRDGIARGLGAALAKHPGAAGRIDGFFKRRGYKATPSDLRQAVFPKGSEPIENDVGTAPGFYLKHGDCHIFVLPGPPREMRPMVTGFVVPRLRSIFGGEERVKAVFRTAGAGESVLNSKLAPIFKKFSSFNFSSLPYVGGVDIVAVQSKILTREEAAGQVGLMERELKRVLGTKFYGMNDETLEEVVGRKLTGLGMTLAVAESLTGGLIGKRLTDVPGSSRYFLADVVAYSNEAKMKFLGVNADTLKKYGAVSEAVCTEMADGARSTTGASLGLATTGIAGPTGGSKEKPLGLCYYGLSWEDGREIKRRVFRGNRASIREQVSQASLLLLYEFLSTKGDRAANRGGG